MRPRRVLQALPNRPNGQRHKSARHQSIGQRGAPVRRVLKPARFGSVSIDLAFTAVFVAVIVLRTVVVPLIPF